MPLSEFTISEGTLVLNEPIDITSVDKSEFLFYLADRTPLSIDELADDCTSPFLRSTLTNRFGTELRIDRADHIRLTGEARQPVIKASKPVLKTAQQLLTRGDALLDEAEYSQAVDLLSKSVSLLETIYKKLGAVDHESTTVEKYLTTTQQKHDHAAKESTKDSINYHVLQAQNYESRGDKQREDDPSAAASEYQKAKQAFEDAIEAAKQYNSSRAHDASAGLSVTPLSDQLESINAKLSTVNSQVEEADSNHSASNLKSGSSNTSDSPEETDKGDDGGEDHNTTGPVSLDKVQSDLSGFGTSSRIGLEREGYESVADIRNSSRQELTNIDAIGPQMAERLLSYAESKQAQSTTTNDRASSTDTDQASVDRSKGGTHEETRPEQAGAVEGDNEASSRHRQLDQSAFENSWDTITKSRIDGQFLAKVTEIKPPRSDRKSETLIIVDRNGKELKLDVWTTHKIDIDWSIGEWYALMEATGNVWETDYGNKKRLSTTSDFKILRLGSDYKPDGERPFDSAEEETEDQATTRESAGTSSNEDDKSGSGQQSKEVTQQQDQTDEDAEDDDGILDGIVSDFDGLE